MSEYDDYKPAKPSFVERLNRAFGAWYIFPICMVINIPIGAVHCYLMAQQEWPMALYSGCVAVFFLVWAAAYLFLNARESERRQRTFMEIYTIYQQSKLRKEEHDFADAMLAPEWGTKDVG